MPHVGDSPTRNDSALHVERSSAVSTETLDTAVAQGIITSTQRDQLLALHDTSGGAQARTPRAFNLVAVGYWAGTIAVLFALGWFLVDRWKSLRPHGVLLVALLYALAFTLSSVFLSRLKLRLASGLFAVLTVGMTPIVAWSVESLLGIWPRATVQGGGPFTTDVIATIRWIPIELSTALAALIALRLVRFGMLTLAITIPLGLTMVHLTPWLFDPEYDGLLWGWVALVTATGLFAAGFAVQQRTLDGDEDFASWAYLTGLGFFLVGFVNVADQSRVIPHSLPGVVALFVALALMLANRIFLVLAAIFFVGYLGFLATDVFASAVGFMLVMCAAGALVILLTVLAQRRFPALVRRLSSERRSVRPPAATGALLVGMTAVTLVLLGAAVSRAPAMQRERMAERRLMARQAAETRQAREAVQRARARDSTGRETSAPRQP